MNMNSMNNSKNMNSNKTNSNMMNTMKMNSMNINSTTTNSMNSTTTNKRSMAKAKRDETIRVVSKREAKEHCNQWFQRNKEILQEVEHSPKDADYMFEEEMMDLKEEMM